MHSLPDNFWAWASTFSSNDLTGMIITGCVCAVAAVALICFTVYQFHKMRAEHALKRELLDRGLGADEVARIINAKASFWK